MSDIHERALRWWQSEDTGVSSKTIMHVFIGGMPPEYGVDIPHDPSDFGRCYRLLAIFPEWRIMLPVVAERYPKWKPLVDNWDELEKLYEEEYPSGTAPKLWERMKSLYNECMIADGWTKTGHGSYSKERK